MTDPCIDLDKAKMYLQYHVQNKVIKYIQPLIKTNLNQNQVDAIISLVYNIGAGGFAKSTLLKRINKDPMDSTGITEAFLMWKNAGGKPILLKRRKREVALYFS
jgi:lysozyme